MTGLTTPLLARAFQIYLAAAYPDGRLPTAKRRFADVTADQSLAALLAPPVCQPVPDPRGGTLGYSWRMGSSSYPHVKMQVRTCGNNEWVFGVDTHDTLTLAPDDPDAAPWLRIQEANRRLKADVEAAWEAAGLLTFNAVLRRGLE